MNAWKFRSVFGTSCAKCFLVAGVDAGGWQPAGGAGGFCAAWHSCRFAGAVQVREGLCITPRPSLLTPHASPTCSHTLFSTNPAFVRAAPPLPPSPAPALQHLRRQGPPSCGCGGCIQPTRSRRLHYRRPPPDQGRATTHMVRLPMQRVHACTCARMQTA